MPRACVIVLDAVGAGELPDAADFGDEGSDTLGNVARAVGGLDLPTLEALGLGNVAPLQGCPPQPGAPAVAAKRSGLSSDARAAVPIPVAARPNSWRRVTSKSCSRRGSMERSIR